MSFVLSAIILNVIYDECHKRAHYAKCHYAECHYAECRYTECRGATKMQRFTRLELQGDLIYLAKSNICELDWSSTPRLTWGRYH
jgi:hypothetical protein